MKKYIFSIFIFLGLVLFAGQALAEESNLSSEGMAKITYPIQELGGCIDQDDCAYYCDDPKNQDNCLIFAKNNNLISEQEVKQAEKMIEATKDGGPGECKTEQECKKYCETMDVSRIDECVSFAEKYGLIPEDQLKEAKQILQATQKGVKVPGNCKNKEECDKYCADSNNIQECIVFAEAAGFVTKEEADMVKKTGGKGPGNCQGKAECDKYCSEPNNIKDCMNFAKEYGLMSESEAKEADQVLKAIESGVTPPPCRGKEECDEYCQKPENSEQCVEFAIAAGFIAPEEAEQVRKMAKAGLMGGGPGGCKGKEECDVYCEEKDHMVECVEFAEKAGFMSPEEAKMAKKAAEMGLSGGPGGCKGEAECKSYCDNQANMSECIDFGTKMGMMKPEEAEQAKKMVEMGVTAGPGGCKGQEECNNYCQDKSHMQECLEFGKKSGMIPAEQAQQIEQMMQMKEQFDKGEGLPQGPQGPNTEEMKKEVESKFQGRTTPPTQEEIQQVKDEMKQKYMPTNLPQGVELPDEVKNMTSPPTQQQIEQIKNQMMQQQMQQTMPQGGQSGGPVLAPGNYGPPSGTSGGGQNYGPPSGMQNFGPPNNIPQQ